MDSRIRYTGSIPALVSLTEQVYAILKKGILSLELKPGEALVEAELAKRLGTSKTPVREALRTLETEGLVVIIPYKGALVARLVPEDMEEIYQVRGALEGMIARIAVKVLTDEQVKEMELLQKQSELALAAGQLGDASRYGAQTHKYLLRSINHRRIAVAHNNLEDHLERFQRELEQIPGRVAKSVVEHRKIVDAISARDADGACLAVINHVESFLTEYLAEFQASTADNESHIAGR